MQDNDNVPPTDLQTPGEHRVVWRGDTPLMAETDAEGVVHLYPIEIIPDAFWNLPFGRLCVLPSWANGISDPTQQFLVLLTVFGNRTLEAIDALRDIKGHLEATRVLIENGVNGPTEKRLADLLDMVKATLKTLDP